MLDLVHTDIYENNELKHWGILGMHWGIRRYQNPDGSLTPEGRERYGVKTVDETKKQTYSQKMESLKYKKNRTDKENEKLQALERGEKYFRANFNKKKSLKDLSSKEYKEGQEWFFSTNFGKGAQTSQLLGGFIGQGIYYAKNYSDWEKEMGFANDKPSKRSYVEDNWRRADKEVEAQLKNDKRYQKYVKDKSYHTWNKETGERIDYYSILWDKTQAKLEKEYQDKYGKE